MTKHPPSRGLRRRAVVLLIVLVMLTLFAVAGLTFVLYAESASESARFNRDAESLATAGPDVPPGVLLDYFLNQLLYDTTDDGVGAYSALRGHSLLRGMYGLDYDFDPNGVAVLGNNSVPYNGTGRLHLPSVFAADAAAPAAAQDDYNLVNYTYFPADGFLRDPERPGVRSDLSAPRKPFWGAFNAPYTYPDLNNMFLAAVKADGTVLLPSFHRPWAGFGPLDPANPNWTDATTPWLKYMVLRPRPADNPPINGRPGFPLPADPGGDVKNLLDAPGGNDSIWLDLNFPVMTAADGRKFKVLFAPLIVDLDGRVNVNFHGDMRGAAGAHASNQGYGPWEVGLNRVLNADPAEWQNLLHGVRDPASLPGSAVFGPRPHFYSRVDFDGCQANGAPSPPLQLPAAGDGFPLFPAGYDDADAQERAHHPSLSPGGQLALSDLAGLLRPGASPTTSGLFALCPTNFSDPRIRRLVTTQSYDPDWPGFAPWAAGGLPSSHVFRDPRYPNSPERLDGGGPKPFPNGPGGEFTPEGRAAEAALGRVDLNRPLPDYPPPSANGQIADMSGFTAAQSARQELARDLFVRFIAATGAYDPAAVTSPSASEVRTLRWLAQLAVNMVDFIDDDDYSTPFNWGRAVGSPAFAAQYGDQWVFGTELPRVVLNEAYAECVNLPNETGPDDQATHYQVNVWVELHNPFRRDPTLHNGGDARLDGGYQLVLTQPNKRLLGTGDAANALGDPDNTGAAQAYDPNQVYSAFSTVNPAALPVGGYAVLGPPEPAPGAASWEPGGAFPAARLAGMTYQTPVAPGQAAPPPAPTVLLRRLACPGLPYQPDPAVPLYNPYITVDYLENVHLNNALSNTGAGYLSDPPPAASRYSVGRLQPYDGAAVRTLAQSPASAQPNQAQQTFGGPNRTAAFPTPPPADWLVHLDRAPISPMEMLHVSCCKPHQLTHLFKDGSGDDYQSFNQSPYWLLRDASSPLYRIFEAMETHSRVAGVAPGDRVPGRININTIWDPETFSALCDAQPSNYFDDADVGRVYGWMTASRTPAGAPGPGDRPFKALGAPFFQQTGAAYADGNGLEDTILRSNPNNPLFDATARPIRLFEIVKQPLQNGVIQDHPYQRYELLDKVYNQATTRSNVFAVWLTVGFFEVNDDASRPVKLGAEIAGPNGRPVRHRLFAILDRSDLPRIFPIASQPPIAASTPVAAAGSATIAPTAMGGAGVGCRWAIRPGMVLQVAGLDANGAVAGDQVVVTATTAVTFTALFHRAFPQGLSSISGRGNPGPGMSVGDPNHDRALTPYADPP
ncbi:MAG TPA: hypothetical protein VMS17_33045 [Gemmataceae bacterium]|nr:hypothetical protein [Gemmataceae bacterium]